MKANQYEATSKEGGGQEEEDVRGGWISQEGKIIGIFEVVVRKRSFLLNWILQDRSLLRLLET